MIVPDAKRPRNATESELLRSALLYAARGWRVFPIWWLNADGTCACGGSGNCKPAKHPHGPSAPHAFHSATTDKTTIRRWWKKFPHANVGIATGEKSNLLVIDEDGPDGMAAFDAIAESHEQIPQTFTVSTGGGGRHRYYSWPADPIVEITTGTKAAGIAVDWRGDGGYVVAPPSRTNKGPYEVLDAVPVAEAPAWLIDLVRKKIQKPTPAQARASNRTAPTTGPRGGGATPKERCRMWLEKKEPPDPRDDHAMDASQQLLEAANGAVCFVGRAPDALELLREWADRGPRGAGHYTDRELMRKIEQTNAVPGSKADERRESESTHRTGNANPLPGLPGRAGGGDAGSGEGTQDADRNDGESTASPSWPDIVPLSEAPEADEFPIEVLPGQMQHVVREIAAALNVPPDFAAVPLLILAGASIGMSRQLEIVEGHVQHPLLYAALIAPPGTKKSPALATLRRPLDAIEREYHLEWKASMKVYKAELAECRAASRGKGRPTPIEPDRPILRRVVTGDATIESIGKILSENPRGVVAIRDELSAWVSDMDRYKTGKGGDRSAYLSINSSQRLIIDRKGTHDNGPLVVDRPFLSIVGNMTPSSLPMIKGTAGDDGFMDRIVVSYPASLPHRGATRQGVSASATDALDRAYRKLHTLEMIGETRQGSDEVVGWRPRTVNLTEDGWDAWKAFTDELADEMNGDDFPLAMRGPFAKLEGYCGRMALLLHYLRWACDGDPHEGAVDGNSMRDAARLVGYFKSHAKKVYHVMEADPGVSLARWLLRSIEKRLPDGTGFTARDAHQWMRGPCKKPEEVQAPLDLLVKHGYVRKMQAVARSGAGRKPSDRYEVNPSHSVHSVHSVQDSEE